MLECNLRKRDAFSEWTIAADNAERRVARAIRICVGKHLQEMYGGILVDLFHRRLPTSYGVWIAGLLLNLRLGRVLTWSFTSRRRNFPRNWRNQSNAQTTRIDG